MLLGPERFNINIIDPEDINIHDRLRIATQEDEVAQKIINTINASRPYIRNPWGKLSIYNAEVKDQLNQGGLDGIQRRIRDTYRNDPLADGLATDSQPHDEGDSQGARRCSPRDFTVTKTDGEKFKIVGGL